jgi:hypothetical protein
MAFRKYKLGATQRKETRKELYFPSFWGGSTSLCVELCEDSGTGSSDRYAAFQKAEDSLLPHSRRCESHKEIV